MIPVERTNHTIIDAFNATKHSSPSYQFGSAIRPRLSEAEPTPGAGAYSIKTTILGNVPDSKIHSAPQFSLRSREKFGNPMLRALDTETARQPGPGWYTPKQVNPKDDNAPKYSFPTLFRHLSESRSSQPNQTTMEWGLVKANDPRYSESTMTWVLASMV
mmetsp:Transcript_19068/g.59712  ORF Transcript_19068/g.59712 Transcript_19068/m.59712 type:complete len:160 (+) Transcript_19068:211-690(+)